MKKLNITIVFLLFAFTKFAAAQTIQQPYLRFTNLADMPAKLTWPATVTDGENLYAINGLIETNKTGFSDNVFKYDPKTDKWNVLSRDAGFKLQGAAVYLPEPKLAYIFGGLQANNKVFKSVQMLSLLNGALTDLNLNNPAAANATSAAVWDNQVYLFGGSTTVKKSINSLYRFDPKTIGFTKLADMPATTETSGAIVNGVLYTFGGFDQFLQVSNSQINAYDIKTNVWTAGIAELPQRISSNCVAVYGSLIFVIGDYRDESFLGCFDTKTKKFIQLKSNMDKRRAAGAVVIGSKLYVYGGKSGFQQKAGGGNQTLQCADLSQWTPMVFPGKASGD